MCQCACATRERASRSFTVCVRAPARARACHGVFTVCVAACVSRRVCLRAFVHARVSWRVPAPKGTKIRASAGAPARHSSCACRSQVGKGIELDAVGRSNQFEPYRDCQLQWYSGALWMRPRIMMLSPNRNPMRPAVPSSRPHRVHQSRCRGACVRACVRLRACASHSAARACRCQSCVRAYHGHGACTQTNSRARVQRRAGGRCESVTVTLLAPWARPGGGVRVCASCECVPACDSERGTLCHCAWACGGRIQNPRPDIFVGLCRNSRPPTRREREPTPKVFKALQTSSLQQLRFLTVNEC